MKFLLFDCDGVLVDTEAIAARVVTQWLNNVNCAITENEFLSEHTGKTFGSIFKALVDKGALSRDYWKDDTILSLEEIIYEEITEVEGISDCLEKLKGYRKAVISNSRESMVRKALKVTNLENYFDTETITTAERVEKPKPDPGVYLHALNRFNLESSHCIAVEDSLSGVMAASKAGIYTIGFAGASHLQNGHDKQLMKSGASVVAYHAQEIPEIIKRLN